MAGEQENWRQIIDIRSYAIVYGCTCSNCPRPCDGRSSSTFVGREPGRLGRCRERDHLRGQKAKPSKKVLDCDLRGVF